MYIWTFTNPNRDGDLENDIIIHEVTHGVTNRMTGGGTGRCLQTTEAGGMGEGWSDASAFFIQQNSTDIKDYVLGAWVTNNATGIRTYPYSINESTNPLSFSSLKSLDEGSSGFFVPYMFYLKFAPHTVHDIGEVWATMLFELHAAFIQQAYVSLSPISELFCLFPSIAASLKKYSTPNKLKVTSSISIW
ncbi:hypothetical protein FRC03_011377 [Tulasnella sp. 419]|nr:hypothetical protein FRC03_011377 [Tulasnella sp. 419]